MTGSRNLKLGLYRVYWKEGGTSLAAVGMTENGSRWLAPANWTEPTLDPHVWRAVERVEPIADAAEEYRVTARDRRLIAGFAGKLLDDIDRRTRR